MKPKNERELLRHLFFETQELKKKAWHTKNPEKSKQLREREQVLYEQYLLLKGIREVKNRRYKTK